MKSTLSWPRSPLPCAIPSSSSTRKIAPSRAATLTPATAWPPSSAASANARCSTSNSRCCLTTSFAVPPALPCSTPRSWPPAASSSTAPPRASPNSSNLSPSEWLPQSCDLAEQLSREHFFADFQISGDFKKDTAERADLQCTMRRNCNLVFCALRSGSDTNVGFRIDGSARNHTGAAAGRTPRRKDHAAISRHDDLILHHMQSDEFGLVLFLEMTVDRVSHHLTQFFERLALREDGIPERSRSVTAFGRVFDGKNDLLIGHDG